MRAHRIGQGLSYGVLGGLAGGGLLLASGLASGIWASLLIVLAVMAPVGVGFAWRKSSSGDGWAVATGAFSSGAILFVSLTTRMGKEVVLGPETWKWPGGLVVAIALIAIMAWPLATLFWAGTWYARLVPDRKPAAAQI